MAWITPKTNWAAGDVPNKDDFNRIEGNAKDLKDSIDALISNDSVELSKLVPAGQTVFFDSFDIRDYKGCWISAGADSLYFFAGTVLVGVIVEGTDDTLKIDYLPLTTTYKEVTSTHKEWIVWMKLDGNTVTAKGVNSDSGSRYCDIRLFK